MNKVIDPVSGDMALLRSFTIVHLNQFIDLNTVYFEWGLLSALDNLHYRFLIRKS